MRLITWNINGIRSLSDGIPKILDELNADIICLQETKISRDMLTADIANVNGFNSYFSFCQSAKKGYSGVATYCKDECKPFDAVDHLAQRDCELPLGDIEVDNEGRAVIVEFHIAEVDSPTGDGDKPCTSQNSCVELQDRLEKLAIINVYCPRYNPDNAERFEFKLRFHQLLSARVQEYRSSGYHVIIIGDVNIAHKAIDHCEAEKINDFEEQPHRVWMSDFLANYCFVDCFRNFHPNQSYAYTVWNTQTNARATNYGTRIDYIIANSELLNREFFSDCDHLTDQMGSDHCPVIAVINSSKWRFVSAQQLPSLCSKLMPEFRGTQTSIRSFLCAAQPSTTATRDELRAKKRKSVASQRAITNFFTKTESSTSSSGSSQNERSSSNGNKKQRLTETKTERNGVMSGMSNGLLTKKLETIVDERQISVGNALKGGTKNAFEKIMSKKNVPKCTGHGEPAAERTVKKAGPNFNRRFYACARPMGFATDKNARCNFFEWA